MAVRDRDPKDVPEAAPSARILSEQVEDVLSAIRAEIGDEETFEGALDEAFAPDAVSRERLPSRPSIPDILAAAIVIAEPSSPVDAWARGEVAGRVQGEDDDIELAIPPAEPSGYEVAFDEETEDGPATLRPSAVSLPAYAPPRRSRGRWAVLAGSVAALGVLAWRLAAPGAAEVVTAGIAPPMSAPPPAGATESETGTLTLSVSTEGAQVSIDGAPRDVRAPVALPPGPHTVRIEAPGYQAVEREVTIEPGASLALGEITLVGQLQPVIVEVEPKSAYVMVTRSGELTGRRYAAPWPRTIELEPGHYTVVAFRNGLETVLRPLEVRAGGDPVAVRIRLPKEDIYR